MGEEPRCDAKTITQRNNFEWKEKHTIKNRWEDATVEWKKNMAISEGVWM
jgi:hypothetical protein